MVGHCGIRCTPNPVSLETFAFSRRIVRFRHNGLVFECAATKAREDGRTADEDEVGFQRSYLVREGSGSTDIDEARALWWSIVENYLVQKLSFSPRSAPSALRGGEGLRPENGAFVRCGAVGRDAGPLIWQAAAEHACHSGLPPPTAQVAAAPSWFWASVPGGAICPRGLGRGRCILSLKQTICRVEGQNPFGIVERGSIMVEGKISMATVSFDQSKDKNNRWSLYSARSETNFSPDTPLEVLSSDDGDDKENQLSPYVRRLDSEPLANVSAEVVCLWAGCHVWEKDVGRFLFLLGIIISRIKERPIQERVFTRIGLVEYPVRLDAEEPWHLREIDTTAGGPLSGCETWEVEVV